LKQAAIDDLNVIWSYTVDAWSEKQADQYYEGIKQACLQIGNNPNAGRNYGHIVPGLLAYKYKRHLISYHTVFENEVEVIRVLHEQMDVEHRLKA
jgi:toxin ParE1/3/4